MFKVISDQGNTNNETTFYTQLAKIRSDKTDCWRGYINTGSPCPVEGI